MLAILQILIVVLLPMALAGVVVMRHFAIVFLLALVCPAIEAQVTANRKAPNKARILLKRFDLVISLTRRRLELRRSGMAKAPRIEV
jgi:hypothetical protein